jgi:hypothetical protein
MSDNDDIENNVPLEKTKTIKEAKEVKVKEKKPRTEKQKAQFQEVMTKRKENIEKKKLEKKVEASKLLAEKDPDFFKQLAPVAESEVKVKKTKAPKEPTVINLDDESESEESVIIVKRKPKSKKKKKKIIVEESESSSSSSDEEVAQLPKPKRNFVSQQNKKSIIKIHNKPSTPSYENYFV